MVGQPGFFDLADRYEALIAAGDPLERPAAVVDFEVFRGQGLSRHGRADHRRDSRAPAQTAEYRRRRRKGDQGTAAIQSMLVLDFMSGTCEPDESAGEMVRGTTARLMNAVTSTHREAMETWLAALEYST
ncbi:putative transposase [Sphingobium sp. MI1205]|nr:putative transposase [Sphingobium sp. MI1205]